jgi:AraC-like DNA-binding protein
MASSLLHQESAFWYPLSEAIVPRLGAGAIELLLWSRTWEAAGPRSPFSPHWGAARHAHDNYEVCWVVDGRCRLYLVDREVELTPSRACVIRPGEIHQLRSTSSNEPFRTLWWRFTDHGVFLTEGIFAGGGEAISATFVGLDEAAIQRVDTAAHELEARRPHYELMAGVALLEIAGKVLRVLREHANDDGARPERGQTSAWYVRRVVTYVQTHHSEALSLPVIADAIGLSSYYLTTIFRRSTGRGVMFYVSEVRHREALALLRNSDLGVNEIARRVGYADPYYFMRVFRVREGCSPLSYRHLFRGDGPLEAP